MSHCADCVEKARLRNRDLAGMITNAKTQAINEQKPQAVCWEIKNGLFIADAAVAIAANYTIRHILSGLQ